MNKLIIPFLLITAFLAVGCSDDEPKDMVKEIRMQISSETGTYTPWGSETSVECMLVKEEGESEYSPLPFGGIIGFDYEIGHEYELKVRKVTLANPPADASNVVYELIEILRDTDLSTHEPDELPEEAKFKLKMVQLTPFMDLDTPLAAPFDFLTFRILNHKDEFSFPETPKFLQYYDRIEMSSPNLPDTYCVYEDKGTSSGLTSQWGSYFYEKMDFPISLKGYKDGKLIYEYSVNQVMRERDFLGIEWKKGSVTLANPKTACIYNILDTRYEFLLTDTQISNDTPYVRIGVARPDGITDADYLKLQRAGLRWLMKKHLGEKTSLSASDFKTLPQDSEIVETYENKTTLVAILHQNADDLHEEQYYAIAEPK